MSRSCLVKPCEDQHRSYRELRVQICYRCWHPDPRAVAVVTLIHRRGCETKRDLWRRRQSGESPQPDASQAHLPLCIRRVFAENSCLDFRTALSIDEMWHRFELTQHKTKLVWYAWTEWSSQYFLRRTTHGHDQLHSRDFSLSQCSELPKLCQLPSSANALISWSPPNCHNSVTIGGSDDVAGLHCSRR